MSQTGTLAKGYLLKRNKDHRTSNILPGAKYKRRWVEVTADTVVYAATQHDALTGHIQVFAIGDMLAVRLEADTKFQVKFPERTLKFKVATGGKDEREQWVGALHAARKQHEAAQQARNSAAGKLEHLQKALLREVAADFTASTSTTGTAGSISESGSVVLSSAGTSLAGSTLAGSASMPGLPLTTSSFAGAHEPSLAGGSRGPPSPRSLLASARVGMALVSSASPAGTPRARTPAGDAAGAAGAGQPAQQRKPAAGHFFAADDADCDAVSDSSEASSSDAGDEEQVAGAGAAAAACTHAESLAAGEDNDNLPEPHSSSQRPSLVRRITPGVLLTPSRPSTPAAATTPVAVSGSDRHSLPHSPQPPDRTAVAPSLLSAPAPAAAVTRPSPAVDTFDLEAAVAGMLTVSSPDADYELDLDDFADGPVQQLQQRPQSAHSSRTQELLQAAAAVTRSAAGASPASAAAAATAAPPVDSTSGAPFKPGDAHSVYNTALYSTHRPPSSSRSRFSTQPQSTVGIGASEDGVLALGEHQLLAAVPARPGSGGQQLQPVRPGSAQTQSSPQQQYQGMSSLRLSSGADGLPQDYGSGSCPSPRAVRPGMLQVGSRPASANSRPGSASAAGGVGGAYRPGTPLKSCLRNSPRTPAEGAVSNL